MNQVETILCIVLGSLLILSFAISLFLLNRIKKIRNYIHSLNLKDPEELEY